MPVNCTATCAGPALGPRSGLGSKLPRASPQSPSLACVAAVLETLACVAAVVAVLGARPRACRRLRCALGLRWACAGAWACAWSALGLIEFNKFWSESLKIEGTH